uniref:SCP domain-containing protein n=1 Tax=Mesocestoides corti TaxID=53468 RepID=A0A5K3FX48_MESCO
MRRVIYFVMLIWSVVADVPTEEERTQIVEFLTNLRESVDPPATNMLLMKYSSGLETAAQNYLANCSSTGLNEGALPGDVFRFLRTYDNRKPVYLRMLSSFTSDRQSYNYDQNKCSGSCFPYKSMVLATSNGVGCAEKKCLRGETSSEVHFVTCLIKLNGGNTAKRPYRRGDSCSECPDGFACHRKQCFDQPSAVTHSTSLTTSISTMLSPVLIVNVLIFVLSLNA